jgi:CRISPR-associated protein (TIGR03984 family)
MKRPTWNVEPVAPPEADTGLEVWVRHHLEAEKRPWLLAHLDDGVVWGKLNGEELATSTQYAPSVSPLLRLATLQQLFIFGPKDEIRLWKTDNDWQARRIIDNSESDWLVEDQLLWGSAVVAKYDGFTHLRETRQQGLDQVVPIEVTAEQLQQRRLRLRVHHLLSYDDALTATANDPTPREAPENGSARIAVSRLVQVFIAEEKPQ